MKQYLSVKDVSRRYSVGVSTVWQWVKDGMLPAPVKFGQRCTRWDSDELDEHDQQAKTAA
ncbi:MAG: helix-turn-helix domain-containing protein [Candidatus Thiodiazotropha endolucinida]